MSGSNALRTVGSKQERHNGLHTLSTRSAPTQEHEHPKTWSGLQQYSQVKPWVKQPCGPVREACHRPGLPLAS